MMEQSVLPGFPAPVPVVQKPETPESYGRRLTKRFRDMLARGRHPATGRPLANNGLTCNTCAHRTTHRRVQNYYKCDLIPVTFGPLTDIRLSWPACDRYEPRSLTASPSTEGAQG